ncbi:hypothetical protein Pan1_83 [Pseudanabaena phage Pan1]|nr:hypothetical protein Pan1_83 [Pseudanabaena phage Pan1]
MAKIPGVRKVRGEGHWVATLDGKWITNQKHDTPQAALDEARSHVAQNFHLDPGQERFVSDIAAELGIPRRYVEELPEFRPDYHLHVADGISGGMYPRPKQEWTLFREEAT